MKRSQALVCTFSLACLAVAGAARAQGPEPPKPGPEHERLKKAVGVWDATVEMFQAPGQPPEVSKGTETNTMTAGGLWLVTDFKSTMGGQPFEGHGLAGYDPAKKKYVGTWVDSWTTMLATSESTFDPATKTETAYMDMADPTGKVVKTKMQTTWKDDDTRVFVLYGAGPDGKEAPGLKITYKRRK